MQAANETARAYMVSGSVIFMEERVPITLERAHEIHAIHHRNRDRWLLRADLSQGARDGMAKIEQSLADEMAAAIRAVTQPQEIAA